MVIIAIGVLTEEPLDGANDPLRAWAVEVLKNSSDPPVLSELAGHSLLQRSVPAWSSVPFAKLGSRSDSREQQPEELIQEPYRPPHDRKQP